MLARFSDILGENYLMRLGEILISNLSLQRISSLTIINYFVPFVKIFKKNIFSFFAMKFLQ